MRVWRYLVGITLVLPIVAPVEAFPDVPVGLFGNEPHNAVVNPLNPDNVVVARGNRIAVSTDFGLNFGPTVPAQLPAGIGSGYFVNGDSVVAFDANGRLFWTYLIFTNPDSDGQLCEAGEDLSVVVQQVDPLTGSLLGNAVDVTPGTFCDDKPWIAADATDASPFEDNVYMVWTRFDTGEVMFSRSTNNGATWSAPAQVSVSAVEGFVWPAHVATASNGDLFVSYHADTCQESGEVIVIRDSSGGANLAAGLPPVLKTSFPAAVTCNRQDQAGTVPQTDFWMQGANAPYVLTDPDNAARVYVVANDDPDAFGSGDPGDIILARSSDGGLNWDLVRVDNGNAGTLQAFPIGAIDQVGNIVIHWYDTRNLATNNNGNFLLDVYATVSRDRGLTFVNDFRINDVAFDPDLGAPVRFNGPPPTLRIGEYNGVAATDGLAYAAWTGNTATGQQIFSDVFSIRSAFPDRFEPNDAANPGVVTPLGAGMWNNVGDLTIHRATDEDWFQVTALSTGTWDFRMDYGGRFADLDMQILSATGMPLATSTPLLDPQDLEVVRLNAIEGESYLIRVYSEPGQFPPMNVYSLSVVNLPAPTPFSLDLVAATDSGLSEADDLTNVPMPTIRLRLDDARLSNFQLGKAGNGYALVVYNNGVEAGSATKVAGQPGVYEFAFPAPLDEGMNSLTSKVVISDGQGNLGHGSESEALGVTLDTTPPLAPPTPDLAASSDSGGVSDDDVTTLPVLEFEGTGEGNRRIYLYANNNFVAREFAQPSGLYEILMAPLQDGVYLITVKQEDAAGNLGASSLPLKATVAQHVLFLPGDTAAAPMGPVTVDLETGTVEGFPGVAGATGRIGIVGIPTVQLDTGGHALNVLGTAADNHFDYTPTTAAGGRLAREGSSQVLWFSSVGTLMVDPRAGTDSVETIGTAQRDTIKAVSDIMMSAQVNSMLPIHAPFASTELLAIASGFGGDTIEVRVHDTVDGLLFVDAGPAATNPPHGDVLNVVDASGKGKIQNFSGGPAENAGEALVTYAQTTGKVSTIDYQNVEKFVRN